ncbi:MAG: universal stress protein [Proteobacteria bacterium]|nr:universal stress protein [Pseudomonadota bacterium]
MLELSKILVIIEPDIDSHGIMKKAMQLASYTESEVELMIADYSSYLEDGFYFDPLQAQALRYEHADQRINELEILAKPLRQGGLVVTVTTAWGNPPYAEIVGRIRDTKPSLVLKATRQHHKISSLLLSNEDWELIRYCPAPLLLAKGRQWRVNPLIVAAVDPNHMHEKPVALDDNIVSSASSMAAISGGQVHLFHSVCVPPIAEAHSLQKNAEAKRSKLTDLATRHGICKTCCHWSTENVVNALPAKAKELKASVVVMGAVSRSRLDRILIGNTAEKVLDKLECDVLIIKPDQMPNLNEVML